MKHPNHKAIGDFFVDWLHLCRPDLVSITMADVQHGDAKSDTSSEQVSIGTIKFRAWSNELPYFQGDADYSPMGVDLKTLPPVMRGRVKALKNIQLDTIKVAIVHLLKTHWDLILSAATLSSLSRQRQTTTERCTFWTWSTRPSMTRSTRRGHRLSVVPMSPVELSWSIQVIKRMRRKKMERWALTSFEFWLEIRSVC